MPAAELQQLEYLADDVELRRAATKTLKGFCLTYLPHHFPLDLFDFFHEMREALENHAFKRLEMIGFRGCAKKAPLPRLLFYLGCARTTRVSARTECNRGIIRASECRYYTI